jgi:hypothetical protein
MMIRRSRIVLLELISFIILFVFLQNAIAFECFSDAPSIEGGKDIYEAISPRDLEGDEYRELEELFLSLDGRWEGTAEIAVCVDRDGEIFTETDEFLIQSTVTMKRSGDFSLNGTLISSDRKTTQYEIIRLCLGRERLATVCNKAISDIELTSASGSELAYLQKTPKKIGNDRKLVRETLTTIRKTSDTSFTLEKLVYSQGKLAAIIKWRLERE